VIRLQAVQHMQRMVELVNNVCFHAYSFIFFYFLTLHIVRVQVIRLQAVQQVKSMVELVDNVCINAIKTQVAGEVLQTKAPLGVSIIMAKSV
jgi:hypothetical protein